VCDQETSKKTEAKARYRVVKIQPQWVVTPGKQQLLCTMMPQVLLILLEGVQCFFNKSKSNVSNPKQ
jgi:hypothetical protein